MSFAWVGGSYGLIQMRFYTFAGMFCLIQMAQQYDSWSAAHVLEVYWAEGVLGLSIS